MFERAILSELRKWKTSEGRKPLVLRGARQVGKTTVVEQFAREYSQYIHLNLERPVDKEFFSRYRSIDETVQAIFFQYNKSTEKIADTLLFIDEIQQSPEAVALLRYFYEDYPDLQVVAAGSLLETLLGRSIDFPVGRVEYRAVRPVSFAEFLAAMNEKQALEQYNKIPLNDFAHEKLLKLFHTYTLIGGMPAVVADYLKNKDLTVLQNIFESLLISYFDDAEKYAKNTGQIQILRHAIRSIFYEAGRRIKFQGFGASSYNSKEMGEVLRSLEKAMLLQLVFPTTQTEAPFLPDIKKSPRLQVLDTGMLNFFSGVQKELFGTHDLNDVYHGKITEHIVGQELLSSNHSFLNSLHFWVRDKKQSEAEIDFMYPYNGAMLPVEVKSGKSGKLRSLLYYLDQSDIDFAVRFYAGKVQLEEHKTKEGKTFKLLNLPYFLSGRLKEYLDYF
ncbi:MAG: AAA family ATPase [Candidatus Symbiothrix sp.]|jgi:predicted AAA+ superfamily ATPase|nr:AAA family ATPase [Candidatus Symbiothrix sp.]